MTIERFLDKGEDGLGRLLFGNTILRQIGFRVQRSG
jgi:hypothetical protein